MKIKYLDFDGKEVTYKDVTRDFTESVINRVYSYNVCKMTQTKEGLIYTFGTYENKLASYTFIETMKNN